MQRWGSLDEDRKEEPLTGPPKSDQFPVSVEISEECCGAQAAMCVCVKVGSLSRFQPDALETSPIPSLQTCPQNSPRHTAPPSQLLGCSESLARKVNFIWPHPHSSK